jgi:hypothetical protein
MPNFRIHHLDCTRDVQHAIARRDGVTESSLFDQLLVCAAWRTLRAGEVISPGLPYWYCDASGHITLSRGGSSERRFVSVAGPLPEPIKKIGVRALDPACAYTLTPRGARTLALMKDAECNLSGYIRAQIRALAPAQAPVIGIGWRFTNGNMPYFHSDISEPSEFSFIPPPVIFFT